MLRCGRTWVGGVVRDWEIQRWAAADFGYLGKMAFDGAGVWLKFKKLGGRNGGSWDGGGRAHTDSDGGLEGG
ncbi:hypothetical protein LIER_33291 [Lithospermum erythrorhizon]|uniref:Uncharacterized protein n=1 Tax=Lithospermum erythrorhizon TaxID=34254 RepID=A0AAV3RWD0_LITER